MQYSPDCMIPYVSLVDAGTVEMVRSLGVEVVTADGSLSAHFEHTVAVTDDGPVAIGVKPGRKHCRRKRRRRRASEIYRARDRFHTRHALHP